MGSFVSEVIDFAVEVDARKKRAQERFSKICSSNTFVNVNSLRIGFNAHLMKRDNDFGILGFEDEDAARVASGVGRSSWYANIRLAEYFEGIDEETFCAAKQDNLSVMTDLPQSKRLDAEWLRLATDTPIKEFKKLVDDELNGRAKASDGKERSTNLKVSMPASRKTVIEEKLEQIAKDMGEKDQGRALELVLVERTEGVSLIGAMRQAIDRIAEVKKLNESLMSPAEILERTFAELDGIVELFRTALELAQTETE